MRKRELLTAAATARITMVFDTLIRDILVSLEAISYFFSYKVMWHSFLYTMKIVATLKILLILIKK